MNRPLLLGILGGGQLGRMTALAAIRMGVEVRTLSPAPAGPVANLGDARVGDWTDPVVLASFADGCDAITVESEWAPAELLSPLLAAGIKLFPSPLTLERIRHKGVQKQTVAAAGLPVPPFMRCRTPAEARAAATRFGYPVMLKRFEGSYDGYGNATAHHPSDIDAAWPSLAADDGLLVEAWVDFVRELSVLVARRADGVHVIYPVAFTEQRDHRCHAVVVPADVSVTTEAAARRVAIGAAEAVSAVGMLGVELFELPDGTVLLNELAPRPHNTGHYSIEGCHTSQFENHVRAVLGWPLGDPGLRSNCAVMVNVLGHRAGTTGIDGLVEALAVPGAAVHLYGKREVRPNRKMGHVTVTGDDPYEVRRRAEQAAAELRL